MKALVSIQFALELDDEDELVTLAHSLDEGLRKSIEDHFATTTDNHRASIELLEIGGMIDWYGASVAIKRPVLSQVGGE